MNAELVLRPATADDLPEIAELYLAVRAAAVPAMPPIVHPPDEVRAWVGGWNLIERETWLAETDRILGFCVLEESWLDMLYVAPDAAGNGVGSALLALIKAFRPDGFALWVFESNAPARRFYARHDLVEHEVTDGSQNEERAPDIRVAWPA